MLERGAEKALQAQDVERAIADLLGAGFKLSEKVSGHCSGHYIGQFMQFIPA